MSAIFCPWEPAKYLIFSSNVPGILYYALLPGMLSGILLSLFVFYKRRKSLDATLLFLISLAFFIWGFFDLILFATNDSTEVIVYWSLTILVEPMIYAASLYLAYAFFDNNRDISFLKKVIIISPFFFLAALAPTAFNLEGVRLVDCTAIEGPMALYWSYFLELSYAVWILILAIDRYRKEKDVDSKKRILLFTSGILIFLVALSSGNIIGSFTSDWVISQYGYFGMPVFIGFLSYLIVRYKAFDIKIIGAQALIGALVILIGSQFFFVRNNTNRILTGITLSLTAVFGYVLILNIKREIRQREQLQKITRDLAIANGNLQKLDTAKNEFISIASHQLRTPLTAIKGFISLILEGSYGPLREEHRGVLSKVFLANERLIFLVEDLLNLSRIESGRMEYEYGKVALEKICQELYDTFTIRAKEKKLEFTLEIPQEKLPEVETDRKKIREVISNIIDNAIKYTPQGSVKISFYQEDGFVCIKVADTGVGISKEEMDSLFQKFSRGKDISRIDASGTGLGLHVGRSMMEAMGGTVRVESPGENQGSTFFIEVPVERGE